MIDKVSFVVAFITLASTILYYDYMLTEQYPKDVAEFNWFFNSIFSLTSYFTSVDCYFFLNWNFVLNFVILRKPSKKKSLNYC